jgi:hypothetical protein
MTTTARWTAALLALGVSCGAARLPADEEPAAEKKVREATAEEVPPVLADLEAAFKKKKTDEALALLKKVDELKHVQFEKPLQKLLRHSEPGVALRAAELLEERTYPESGKAVWAASWGQAANDKRPAVRAKALRALGKIGFALDKKQFDDVQKVWRSVQSSADRSQAPLLMDIAFYAELTKDKRFARDFAEAVDKPESKDSGPNNPPASWWEGKFYLWEGARAEVNRALKAITGQDFDSTAKAKEWIEAHKKEGFDW